MKGLPDLKVCNVCGAICEVAIEICPGASPSIKISFVAKMLRRIIPRRYLRHSNCSFVCSSSDFRPMTFLEFEQLASRESVRVFFLNRPTWPDPDRWQDLLRKEELENKRKTK